MLDQMTAALRGHAKWIRNYRLNPSAYHEPSMDPELLDAAATEIERLWTFIAKVAEVTDSIGRDAAEVLRHSLG